MPNTPSPLDLKNVRKTIDEIDEQIVKYIAYIKYATEATVDNKYYDTKPGDEVMEQKIGEIAKIFKSAFNLHSTDMLIPLLRYRFKIMSQVAENKAVEYTAGEKVQLTRRPRELEVLSLLREHAEVYGMSRQVDEFVQSYEQLFTKSKEYQAHVLGVAEWE